VFDPSILKTERPARQLTSAVPRALTMILRAALSRESGFVH
jgi:hypothetical protein